MKLIRPEPKLPIISRSGNGRQIPTERISYIDQWIAECGHVTAPSAVAALVDKNRPHMWCARCGEWQWGHHKATPREVYNDALGLPLDYVHELPEEPPF